MAKRPKRKKAIDAVVQTLQVNTKARALTMGANHPRGMYLEVIIKDNAGPGEVLTAVNSPADVALVEQAITRLVRQYLRGYSLVPPKGFYSLHVMPRWVPVTPEVSRGGK